MALPRVEIPIVVLSEASPTSPIAGAIAYVKSRETKELITVYSDSGSTEGTITQPLTTDSGGRLTGWLPRGSYEVDITVSGKIPYTEYLDISPGSDEGVDTDWIADEAITAGKIGPEAVTTAKVQNLAIAATKLAAEAVETSKIANLAVTAAKLAELCVTEAKIADKAVTARKQDYSSMMGVAKAKELTNIRFVEYTAIPGASVELNLPVACKLNVAGVFDFTLVNGGVSTAQLEGALFVDGVNSAFYELARFYTTSGGTFRQTVSQNFQVALAAGIHTLDLRAHVQSTEGITLATASGVGAGGTKLMWWIAAS